MNRCYMSKLNILIFVDLIFDDFVVVGEFYVDVFGWGNDFRFYGVFYCMVSGGNMYDSNGNEIIIGNFYLGIYKVDNICFYFNNEGVDFREIVGFGCKVWVWILVSDDDIMEDIFEWVVLKGVKVFWKDYFWYEFNGFNFVFEDLWGNEIIFWGKGGVEF